MRQSSTIAKLGLTICLAAAAAACGPAGPGGAATGGAATGGVGPKKDRGSLRRRVNDEHRLQAGANYFRAVVHYEGGPNESWVMEHDGGSFPPELEGKPGMYHDDDPDVELLEPANGAPQIALEVPAFCDRYSAIGLEMNFEHMDRGFMTMKDAAAVLGDLRVVAWGACDRAHYEPRQKRVQRLLQAFENEAKMPVAELTALLEELAASKPEDRFCGTDPQTRWFTCGEAPKSGPLPSIAKLDVMEMSGESFDEDRFRMAMTFAVATSKPLGWDIEWKGGSRQLASTSLTIAPAKLGQERRDLAEAAVRAIEVQSVEWDAIGLSLLSKEKSPVTKYLLEHRLASWRKAIDASIASLGSDVSKAKSAEEAWRKDVLKPNEKGIKAAFVVIENPSAAGGCATVESTFTAAVTAKAPKSWKEATALLADPTIDLLAQARQQCHQVGGLEGLAKYEMHMLEYWGRRSFGPRTSAVHELDEYPKGRNLFDPLPQRTVKSLAAKGDSIEVGFEPEVWTETPEVCTETRIIDSITWDGRIVYRQNCVEQKPVTHRDPLPPATLPKSSAAGLKKGHVVQVTDDGGKGTLVTDYANKKDAEADTGLAVFLGVVIKP